MTSEQLLRQKTGFDRLTDEDKRAFRPTPRVTKIP